MKQWGIATFFVLVPLVHSPSALAKTWYVKVNGSGDAPTIQAAADSCSHGDSVLVAPGTYTWSNQGTGNDYGLIHILRGSADMVIVSEAGPQVTFIDAQGQGRVIFFQGETELTVDGFTIRNGVAPLNGNFVGGGFAAHLSSPVVRNCFFRNNSGNSGGAYWYGGVGAPIIENCLFENNNASVGGAVRLINSYFTTTIRDCTFRNNSSPGTGGAVYATNIYVLIESCLFVSNSSGSSGGGFYAATGYPSTVRSCTFYQNSAAVDGGGIYVAGGTDLTVERTIISHGSGGGAQVDDAGMLTLSCTDIYGNIGGNWTGNIAGQAGINGNFSGNPVFCGPGSGDFSLDASSPCAPGNHPNGDSCGLVGAFPVSCGAVSVEERSWGAIKSMYAD